MKTSIYGLFGLALIILIASCQPKEQKADIPAATAEMLKGNIEPYYFAKTISGDFDTIIVKVTEALKSEGFGVVTKLDLKEKFKEKLDIDYKKYVILGACNPVFAHKALELEDKIGTMLPCNVVIQETGENSYEIAAVNPVASMMAIDNPQLTEIAIQVRAKLQAVVEKVQ